MSHKDFLSEKLMQRKISSKHSTVCQEGEGGEQLRLLKPGCLWLANLIQTTGLHLNLANNSWVENRRKEYVAKVRMFWKYFWDVQQVHIHRYLKAKWVGFVLDFIFCIFPNPLHYWGNSHNPDATECKSSIFPVEMESKMEVNEIQRKKHFKNIHSRFQKTKIILMCEHLW